MLARNQNKPSAQELNAIRREAELPKWAPLYRIAGVAAIVMLVLMPIQIAVFTIWPTPSSVPEWFRLFKDNWLLGLMHLDLLYIINNIIVAIMCLAFCMSLRQKHEALLMIALLAGLLGIGAYFSSNSAFEMLDLSRQFAQSASDAEKAIHLAAGQVMIAQWKGTAFDIYYELNAVSLLIMAGVMFKSAVYGKTMAAFGFLSGLLMLIPSTAGMIGRVFALASLVPWAVFSAMSARKWLRLFRLGQEAAFGAYLS